MKIFNNIFLRKKILIYGLGKSGISSYKFLKNKSDVYVFDDNQKNNLKLKKKIIRYKQIQKMNFDVFPYCKFDQTRFDHKSAKSARTGRRFCTSLALASLKRI